MALPFFRDIQILRYDFLVKKTSSSIVFLIRLEGASTTWFELSEKVSQETYQIVPESP